MENSNMANPQEILEQNHNKKVVRAFYEAITTKNVERVHNLLAPDLEWWFHGPPAHQHLMRLLTGASSLSSSFVPLAVVVFGSTVIAEGYDSGRSVAWVHAWTVTAGKLTQVREYCNTSVTVTLIGNSNVRSPSSSSPSSSSSLSAVSDCCRNVWQSKLCDESVPGFVLAL